MRSSLVELTGNVIKEVRHIGSSLVEGQRVRYVLASVCEAVSNFLYVFSLLVPLKILLIASSPGVPGFLGNAIPSLSRVDWLIGLTGLSVVLFLFSTVLHSVTGLLTGAVGERLIRSVRERKTIDRGDIRALRTACKTKIALNAEVISLLLSLGVVIVLDPAMPMVIAILVGAEFIVTALLLKHGSGMGFDWLVKRILRNTPAFLRYIMAINFFVIFFYLLSGFFEPPLPNIIVTLIILIFSRRTLQAVDQLIKKSNHLAKSSQRLSAMLVG